MSVFPTLPAAEVISTSYAGLLNESLALEGLAIKETAIGKASLDLLRSQRGLRTILEPATSGHPIRWAKAQEAVKTAQAAIEARRMTMVAAAAKQMDIVATPTFSKLGWVNPAERLWMERTAPRLARIAGELYTAQTNPDSRRIEHWMKKNGDALSRWHFDRVRTADLPALLDSHMPKEIEHAEAYASSVPWFPAVPRYSAMLPSDMTPEELSFLVATYPSSHPVRTPYTVVERATRLSIRKLRSGPRKTAAGLEYQWLVDGQGGQKYKVTHMRFHPRYSSLFQRFAKIVKESADITDGITSLHPSFRNYLLEMVECLMSGDFVRLLKADLNQTEGNVFLTFFPHEGYWDDNMKFPWMFEIAIRDQDAIRAVREKGYVLNRLEDRARAIASRLGAPQPSHVIDMGEVEKMVQVVWMWRNGGFVRAFPHGEVAGHDYPKADYETVSGHRAVIIADPMMARRPLARRIAAEFLPERDLSKLTDETAIANVLWHEASHGISGNKPDTRLRSGGTLGVAYGALWGKLAEPQSDAAFAVANEILLADNLISVQTYESSLVDQFLRCMSMFRSKERVLQDGFDPHAAGATMTLGWLIMEGIVRLNEGTELFDVDWERFNGSLVRLWEKLTEFGFQGDPSAYKSFFRDTVSAIPEAMEKRIIAGQKKHLTRALLSRNDITAPPKS